MKRRAFIKSIGVLAGTVALASQGIYLQAKEKVTWAASHMGIIKAGDVFTIEGVYAVNGKLQEFTLVNESSSDLKIENTAC